MPLTDDDLDRLGERNELMLRRFFAEHQEKEHLPVWKRIDKIERHQWYERGAVGVILVFLGIIVRK
jgi:hypothetical protein